MELFGDIKDLGISSLFGENIGFPDVLDWAGGLGDTVGTAANLLGFAQKASGALSGVLGGGGGSGEMGGSSTGFVNKALSAAETFQVGQISRQASARERSKEGREGNPHSSILVRELFRQYPDSVKAAGNALMSVALKSGSRVLLQKRAT